MWTSTFSRRLLGALLTAAVASLSSKSEGAIPLSERNALISFYQSTKGPNGAWKVDTNWCKGGSCAQATFFNDAGTECSWWGVTCDGNQTHVIKLEEPNNQLVGKLFPFIPITDLPQLTTFNASENSLTGPIPALAGLTNLTEFDVYNNQLSGPIPALSSLTNLTYFYVYNNQLSGPIPALSGLTNLTYFDVDHNQLTGPIPSLDALGSLDSIHLEWNHFTGLIPSAPPNLAPGSSALCPNPLDITPQPAIDPAWETATGWSAWWETSVPGSQCDLLFIDAFQ